jgi:RND family efflux transporter MFP subunit
MNPWILAVAGLLAGAAVASMVTMRRLRQAEHRAVSAEAGLEGLQRQQDRDQQEIAGLRQELETVQQSRIVAETSLEAERKNLRLELILSDGTTYPQTGTFFFADRQVNQGTGAIRVAGLFPNPGNILRPGQYGKIRASTSTQEGALLVPQRAVTELQGNYLVAVVGEGNKIDVRTVKPGVRTGSLWIIDGGLRPGEQVVVEGVQKVRAGMLVNPKPYVQSASAAGR